MERKSLFHHLIERFYDYGPVGFWAAFVLAIAFSAALTWLLFAAVRRRTRLYLPVFAIVLAAVAVFVGARLYAHRRAWSDRNLSSIHLLPGYTLLHGSGDDSYAGSIERSDGSFRIGIDIGGLSGVWANSSEPEQYEWSGEHYINGHKVWIGLIRSTRRLDPLNDPSKTVEERELRITFPTNTVGAANFFAVVHSERDIVEMLSMVLTYVPIA